MRKRLTKQAVSADVESGPYSHTYGSNADREKMEIRIKVKKVHRRKESGLTDSTDFYQSVCLSVCLRDGSFARRCLYRQIHNMYCRTEKEKIRETERGFQTTWHHFYKLSNTKTDFITHEWSPALQWPFRITDTPTACHRAIDSEPFIFDFLWPETHLHARENQLSSAAVAVFQYEVTWGERWD